MSESNKDSSEKDHAEYEQFSTFSIGDRTYGISVMKVQEVTKNLPMTPVPLSPQYVCGLINLRGQIATAVSLRKLFGIPGEGPEDEMNVVCRVDGHLFSFLVDRIGDVVEVETASKEPLPATVGSELRNFMTGVYKLPDDLLSIIDIEKISLAINTLESSEKGGGTLQ